MYTGMLGPTVTPIYKQHRLAVLATVSNGGWAVEAAVSWTEGMVEKMMQCGPYEGFLSQVEAQSWGIISCLDWIDGGKSERSGFIPVPTQVEQDFPPARVVNRR